MIQIYSPHPNWKQLIWLPSPEWGNVVRSESTMQIKRSMDNSKVVTHIRRLANSRTMEMNFSLPRLKSIELFEFIKIHGAERMKLVMDTDEVVGYLKINPLELEKTSRSVFGDSVEEISVRLDFETVEL